MQSECKYICEHCGNEFSSHQSRGNHYRKIHKIFSKQSKYVVSEHYNSSKHSSKQSSKQIKLPEIPIKKVDKCEFRCRNCNKNFSCKQSRWKHETTCNKEIEIDDKLIEVKNENNLLEIKKENSEMKIKIDEMMNLLQKALKIHPKTLNKINKQLINQNSNNNNNNNIVNNTINIVQLGNENLIEVLSEKQKLRILERQALSLNDLVELIHISPKYKQFKNVCITNLQSSFGQKYDEKSKKFIAVNKNELLNEIVECRMYDIEKFYDENKDKMPPKKAEQIKLFIDRMNDEDDVIKGIKNEEIKLILYNNQDNINNAIVNLQE
jgi:hypothetical protein